MYRIYMQRPEASGAWVEASGNNRELPIDKFDDIVNVLQGNKACFKVIVPMILAFFLKNCCKVAKLKDNIIKHRLNPIASIKTLKGHMHNGQVNNRVSVYQTKIRIRD